MALLSFQFLGHLGYSHCWSHMRPQNWSSMFENLRGRKTSYAECECTYLIPLNCYDSQYHTQTSVSQTCEASQFHLSFAPSLCKQLRPRPPFSASVPTVPLCLYCGQSVPSNRLHYAPLLLFCTYHSYRKGSRIRAYILSFILRLISSCSS